MSKIARKTGNIQDSHLHKSIRGSYATSKESLTDDTDSFIIGDRVWVNGIKPGYIQFIGETQFASGEWAGVVLDNAIGKNDGSVAGIRYFMCEPNRGVFARLNRLTRSPLYTEPILSEGSEGIKPSKKSETKVISSRENAGKLKIGDYVIVLSTCGTKHGILRYLGATNFAAGEWAGIELDEPTGKNDGSVAGQRYFTCANNRGLFAPLNKVTKSNVGMNFGLYKMAPPNHRQNSQESITSFSSLHSNLSKSSKTPFSNTSSTIQAKKNWEIILQENKRELEKILHEKEFCEAELMQKTELLRKKEQDLINLQHKLDYMNKNYSNILHDVATYKEKLNAFTINLDEEKRKNEEIEFQMTEKIIYSAELEKSNEILQTQLKEFEAMLAQENMLYDSLQSRLTSDGETKKITDLDFFNEEISKLKSVHQQETLQLYNKIMQGKQLEQELIQIKKNLQDVHDDLKQKQTEKNELLQVLQQKNDIIDKQAIENNVLQSDNSKLQSQFNEVSTLLQEKCQNLQNIINELTAERQQQAINFNDLQMEKDEFMKKKELEIYELQESQMILEGIINELQAENNNLKLELSCISNAPQAFQNNKTLKSNKSCDTVLNILQDTIQKQNTEESFVVNELQSAMQETARLKESFNNHRKDLEEQLAKTQKEAEDMKMHWIIEKQKFHDLQNSLQQFENERNNLLKRIEQLTLLLDSAQKDQQELVQSLLISENKIQDQNNCLQNNQKDFLEKEQLLTKKNEEIDRYKKEITQLTELTTELNTALKLVEQQKNDSEHLIIKLKDVSENEKRIISELQSCLLVQKEQAKQLHMEKNKLEKAVELKTINEEKLKEEIQEIKNKCKELKTEYNFHNKISEDKIIQNGTDGLYEDSNSQVNFLNSIIADLQNKKDELEARLQIMETNTVFSNDVRLTLDKKVPRLFCDNCDQFDLHNTEDCPNQKEDAFHSHFHQLYHEGRLYCDHCEVFGHSTDNCDKNLEY